MADETRITSTQETLQSILGLAEPPAADARLREDLAMSSYAMMEAAVVLEDKLGRAADFGAIARAITVEDLANTW